MTITLRAGVLNSGIQQNGTEFLTVDTSNNATLSNNLTVTGTITATGAITGSSTVAGSTGILYPLTSGTAVATTSGTSIDFTGIPSWVKRITVMFSALSTNGASIMLFQLGASGGIQNTGYAGNVSYVGATALGFNFSSGFALSAGNAASEVVHGQMVISLIDSSTNKWIETSVNGWSSQAYTAIGGGSKTVSSGPLDRIRLTTVNGTDTFDAGTVNILYE